MFVCVLDESHRGLVDASDCAHPYHATYLGGLCPVVEVQGTMQYDAQGMEINNRLSGLLPFIACYISSTPTRNTMFLGEDRKDVLGSHRIPAHRKWDIALPITQRDGDEEIDAKYGDPKTTFSHRRGRIVDQDDPLMNFASTVTFEKGTPQEYSIRNCPKEEMDTLRDQQRRDAEAKFRELAMFAQRRPDIPKEAIDEALTKAEAERQQQEQEFAEGAVSQIRSLSYSGKYQKQLRGGSPKSKAVLLRRLHMIHLQLSNLSNEDTLTPRSRLEEQEVSPHQTQEKNPNPVQGSADPTTPHPHQVVIPTLNHLRFILTFKQGDAEMGGP